MYLELWKNSKDSDYFHWLENYRKIEPSVKRTFVAYLKNTPFIKNTMVEIENGYLNPKYTFPDEWVDRIKTNSSNSFIFVVDKGYKMYVGFKENTKYGKVQHSSFLDGAPVRLGGYVEVDSNYKIKFLSSNTGHYRTGVESFVDYLKYLGDNKLVDMNELYVQNFGGEVMLAKDFLKQNLK